MKGIICAVGRRMVSVQKREIPDKPEKILVMRSGAIGDVLMTTPFLAILRKRFPESEIHYLVGDWSKRVLDNNPDVDKVIAFDDYIVFRKKMRSVNRLRKKIERMGFDLCFILDKSYLFNLFAYFCRIPFRIGFDRSGEGFPNNLNVAYEGSKHEVDYYLDMARLIGGKVDRRNPELFPTKSDEQIVRSFLRKNKLTQSTCIGIAAGGAENPGQRVHLKRWPREKYAELIKRVKKKGIKIILFGGAQDGSLDEEIIERAGRGIVDAAGKLTIQQSFILMKKCIVFVTHDSGALHIAGAAGIPLIALFGPTPAHRFAPKGSIVVNAESESCPCYDMYGNFSCAVDCMSLIEVDDVVAEVSSHV